MSGRRTRVGVVGAGSIASIAQLPTLVNCDHVELVSLVSRRDDPTPMMRRWGFANVHRTVDDMIATQDLDAVFILTPRSEHAHAVKACLEQEIDVFCEKPLAPAADEAEHLADLADQQGRLLMVDFNRRYAPVYTAGRETFGISGATFAQKYRHESEYRATCENAIHMVDLLRWYCGGEAVDVSAHSTGSDPWEDDGSAALIRFDSGNTGVLVAARTAGAWNEKLDAYGGSHSVEIQAPESVSITDAADTRTRSLSSEVFGGLPPPRHWGSLPPSTTSWSAGPSADNPSPTAARPLPRNASWIASSRRQDFQQKNKKVAPGQATRHRGAAIDVDAGHSHPCAATATRMLRSTTP